MVFNEKAKGKVSDVEVHKNDMDLFLFDVYNCKPIVFEELKLILIDQGLITLKNDEDGFPKIYVVPKLDILKQLMFFFNSQRQLTDDKALTISSKCETFLGEILNHLADAKIEEGKGIANITELMKKFEKDKLPITEEDLADSYNAGFTGEIIVGEGNVVTSTIQYDRLKKAYPAIKLMNAIKRVNDAKSGF